MLEKWQEVIEEILVNTPLKALKPLSDIREIDSSLKASEEEGKNLQNAKDNTINDCDWGTTSIASIPFIEAILPWMTVARKRLQEKAFTQLHLIEQSAYTSLEKFLLIRWSDAVSQSFQLEMAIKKMQGILTGKTSRDRYIDFLQKSLLNRTALRSFFQEYEYLAKHLSILLLLWVDHIEEFLQRLQGDLPILEKAFGGSAPLGKVDRLHCTAGDFHAGGRCVHLLHFTSGKKLVYKPKNLKISEVFYEFLKELNALGFSPALTTYTILNRGNYGWEEWVESRHCADQSEVEAYYQRSGALLCLLYLLEGKDAHEGNIIASGPSPILIDLETLLHPPLRQFEAKDAEQVFAHSVLSTGFLPCFFPAINGNKGSDLSGLGVENEYILEVIQWQKKHTDEMHPIKSEIHRKSNALVKLQTKTQRAENYLDTIICGFRNAYLFIEKNRTFLFEERKWLEKLIQCPVRFVFRSTKTYSLMLTRLYKPQLLLSKELQEKEFEILEREWVEEGYPVVFPLLEEEKKALLQGDIPCFHSLPSSKDLYYKDQIILQNYFNRSSEEIVRERLKTMEDRDQEEQEMFIKHSLLTKEMQPHVHEKINSDFFMQNKRSYNDSEILEAVISLATRLQNVALVSEQGAISWLSKQFNMSTMRYHFAPLPLSLYCGKIGIALFFAALASISNEKKWVDDALNIVKGFQNRIKNIQESLAFYLGIGGIGGIGGLLYSLLHIGRLLERPELIDMALELAETIEPSDIRKDSFFDIISGSAGLTLTLVSLLKEQKRDKLLQLAHICGEHLCTKALKMPQGGLAWKHFNREPFLGFAHGTAGIGYALWRLSEATGEKTYLLTAKAAQMYERQFFSEKEKNWPVSSADNADYQTAWCHGAVGIGLSRFSLFSSTQDEQFYEEYQNALMSTQKALLDGSCYVSLCCGVQGYLEFFLEASKRDKRVIPGEILQQITSILVQKAQLNDSDSELGLFQGQAGLGYTLLRAIDKKNKLPQLLLLE